MISQHSFKMTVHKTSRVWMVILAKYSIYVWTPSNAEEKSRRDSDDKGINGRAECEVTGYPAFDIIRMMS